MKNNIDKYDLNKNWGVPFEIEMKIGNELRQEMNNGIWLCIQELVYVHNLKDTAYEILKNAGFTLEECLTCQEISGSFEDAMDEFINEYF